MDIVDARERVNVHLFRLRLACAEDPPRKSVVVIVSRNHILPINLLLPTSHHAHAVLDRANRQRALSIALGCVAAVAIAAAELLELVVQVSRGASVLW